jgi:hypothetical protein
MESEDLQLFKEFNKKINNIKIHSKANDIYNDYISKTHNTCLQKLMTSVINSKNYKKSLSHVDFVELVNKIKLVKFRSNDPSIFRIIYTSTEDDAQISTLKRLLDNKPSLPDIVPLCDIKPNISETLIIKNCPHCGSEKSELSTTDYVICGYDLQGFDWSGCGFDWCFQCEKKLCKCWNLNHLYNLKNRHHNNNCCKSHAMKTCNSYPDEYCQCRTEFVKR